MKISSKLHFNTTYVFPKLKIYRDLYDNSLNTYLSHGCFTIKACGKPTVAGLLVINEVHILYFCEDTVFTKLTPNL